MIRLVYGEDRRVGEWMVTKGAASVWRDGAKCIGLEHNRKLTAGVLYDNYNNASICAHIAVDGGLTREYLFHIFAYPFLQLQCNVIIGLVGSKNIKSRQFVEHLGFVLSTAIDRGHPDGSLLVYIINKEDCRYISRGADSLQTPPIVMEKLHVQAGTATCP